ncbi:MAG: hypothetical protein DRP83_05535 [Planctomycetota bacterium]|nr:MAG: hypothetical protein DRP83_05535 [Planctomycetota bacterium]
MLAQSFIPAQDMHILVNPANPQAGPWYPAPPEDNPNATLRTTEWTFSFGELTRFRAKRSSRQELLGKQSAGLAPQGELPPFTGHRFTR